MKTKIPDFIFLIILLGLSASMFTDAFWHGYKLSAPFYKTADEVKADFEMFRAAMLVLLLLFWGCCRYFFKKDY